MTQPGNPRPGPLPPANEGVAAYHPLPRAGAARAEGARALRVVDSEQLFAGAVEVQIEHYGAVYRLKRTALGKLILTK